MSSAAGRASHRIGAVLALLAALGFSLKAIFVKLAYLHGVGAPALLALRMLFCLPVFLVVAVTASVGSEPLSPRQKLGLVAVGLCGYYGAAIFDFIGLKYISAGLERLILFTYPTLTLLIGLLVQGRRIERRELLALLVTYGGIALAFVHDLGLSSELGAVATGTAWVLLASLCFAFYLVGSGPLIARLGSARFTALAMLVSTGAVLLHFALAEPWPSLWRQPWQVHGLAAAMALVSTAAPVFLQSAAIRRLDAGKTALVGTIGPMATILFGWWWLGEPLSAMQLAGMALVVTGVLLVGRAPSARESSR
jgi:drug/metabolite transporter (DMT)-like permease